MSAPAVAAGPRAARWPGRTGLVDVAGTTVLCGLALSGFATTYVGYTWAVAGGTGLLAGLLAAGLGLRLRWPVAAVVGLSTVVGLLLSGVGALPQTAVAGVVPGPATLTGLLDGATAGWRELVTTLPPVGGGQDHLRVLPYLCGLAGAVATLLLTRVRWAALPALVPAAVLSGVILLGTDRPAQLWAQGAGFAAAGIAWIAVRDAARRTPGDEPVARAARRRVGRLGGAVTLVALAAAGAMLVTPVLPGAGRTRYAVREHVTPPFDPSEYPSPLAGYRKFEVLDKSTVLFSVRGLPAGARMRLATMDSYDGVVWGVAGGHGRDTAASGVFARVGEQIPVAVPGRHAEIDVTVHGFDEVWLPDAGSVASARFTGPRSADLAASFRYNLATGTAVVPAGLRDGDSYRLDVVLPAVPDAAALSGRAAGRVDLPDLSGVPERVNTAAQNWTASASGATTRLAALVNKLKAGAFSDGTGDSGVPSRPGHGAGRISEFLAGAQLVGDGEQYAATLALLARSLGLPARVVLGVVPPAGFSGDVTGAMVSAWVEVAFDGAGWVPFDPTPPTTNKPDPQQQLPQPDSGAQLKQPPPQALTPPLPLPPPQAANQTTNHGRGPHTFQLPAWLVAAVTWAGPPLALAALLMFTVRGAKRLRRRRRRGRGAASTRLAGGWRELVDRCGDLGIALPRAATRREGAAVLGQALPAPLAAEVRALAADADTAIFGPGDISARSVRDFWSRMERTCRAVGRTRPVRRRVLAAVNPASLRPRPRPAVRRRSPVVGERP